jgi:hypothetical protein
VRPTLQLPGLPTGAPSHTEIRQEEQVVERQRERRLTNEERAEAQLVFGSSLNLDRILLTDDTALSIGALARTVPDSINFAPDEFNGPLFMTYLIHELTHSWQYQHGISLATTLRYSLHIKNYDYLAQGGSLSQQRAAGKRLRDFNTEAQAALVEDYYRALKSGRPVRGQTVADFQPFIADLRAGQAR